jgi:hypothetical protein
MLTTIHLSAYETSMYCRARRAMILAYCYRQMRKTNRRFGQVVGSDGRILDLVEMPSYWR